MLTRLPCRHCHDTLEWHRPSPECPVCRQADEACRECASVRDPENCPRCTSDCHLCGCESVPDRVGTPAICPDCGGRPCDECGEWARRGELVAADEWHCSACQAIDWKLRAYEALARGEEVPSGS